MNKSQRNNGSFCAFIPKKLNIDGRPELSEFPFNILFMGFCIKDGKNYSAKAIYEPDLATFYKNGDKRSIDYRNIYCQDDIVTIERDRFKYSGTKKIQGKITMIADGSDWNMFFVHLTMNGLSKGERCFYERIPESVTN